MRKGNHHKTCRIRQTLTDKNAYFMKSLNEQQKQAVTFSGKHLLVLAGAGTGKTRTIIERALYLIRSGVPAYRIMILSFTRKSAREIVERIRMQTDNTLAEGLTGQTFHSWCMSVIKNNPDIFAQSDYTILDEDDRESCFKLLCGKRYKDKDGKVEPSLFFVPPFCILLYVILIAYE